MAKENEPAKPANSGKAAPTSDDSTSGQENDAHRDEGTAVGSDGDIPSSNPAVHIESSGDGNNTNGIATSGVADDKAVDEGIQLQTEPQAKKKKKKKSKRKGGAARKNVTGFEEYYADAPVTPAEAAQEKSEVYNLSRSLAERIEECIQRYRASRRMDSERTNLFNKYMWLGGVDTSQRQFTGFANDRDALEEADADEIRKMTATDFVGGSGQRFFDPLEQEHWVVDFEGIIKGYLSRLIPGIYLYDEPVIRKAAELIKNFLNYVLMHDVCPEYTSNIMAARNICDIGPLELRSVHELYRGLPGDFNLAASSLFHDRHIEKVDVTENFDKLFMFRLTVIFSALLSDEIREKFVEEEDPTTIYVANTKEETYEVVDIVQPHPKHILAVEKELEKQGYGGKAKPAGVLKLRPSIIDFGYDNVPRSDEIDMSNAEVEEYLLEDELLAKFEKGMKIRAVVCELNIGLRFIHEVKDLRVSFDLFLPQMLMENWKEPVPNTRPAPSAANPNAEEDAVGGDEEAF
ncbi:Argonaute siRNA chaperone complex subunit Arb1-domain-containing protein [Hypoxylon rubiginosum]|uniref:Argonaute siRNA chaperone complex subunit Arb1-domain-containing protein n=1 Tax=Hypoxylon rubiginosum TaxID=110542 RepID=A0ACB9Z4Z9_9PEZI|nr:Argonaute siRNA chaperone complex subunit Arb1-domain-containing protein [Hypoxylon rubiginosum]